MVVTMITLDFRPDEQAIRRQIARDFSAADEATIRYELYPGDIIFRTGSANFDTNWGWIPLLDFAVGVRDVVFTLAVGAAEQFEFTESEAVLTFARPAPDVIQVAASYTADTAAVARGQFAAAITEFSRRVFNSAAKALPSLVDNPTFLHLKQRTTDPVVG